MNRANVVMAQALTQLKKLDRRTWVASACILACAFILITGVTTRDNSRVSLSSTRTQPDALDTNAQRSGVKSKTNDNAAAGKETSNGSSATPSSTLAADGRSLTQIPGLLPSGSLADTHSVSESTSPHGDSVPSTGTGEQPSAPEANNNGAAAPAQTTPEPSPEPTQPAPTSPSSIPPSDHGGQLVSSDVAVSTSATAGDPQAEARVTAMPSSSRGYISKIEISWDVSSLPTVYTFGKPSACRTDRVKRDVPAQHAYDRPGLHTVVISVETSDCDGIVQPHTAIRTAGVQIVFDNGNPSNTTPPTTSPTTTQVSRP